MRAFGEGVLGVALFALVVVAAARRTGAPAPQTRSSATPSASPSSSSGPGFTLCAQDRSWRRPTEAAQLAHLGADRPFDGVATDAASDGARLFRSPAVLYDGSTGLSSIAELTGLWSAWPATTCSTEQPQVFLFGYEPVAYDAQAPDVGTLEVRAAAGFRSVVLTGPIRPVIAVTDGGRRMLLDVPVRQVSGGGQSPSPNGTIDSRP